MNPAPARRPGPRTARLIPKAEAPTRHPRRPGAGLPRVGERLTVRFTAVAPDGAAVARVGSALLAVRFGVPGEEAVVEVVQGGRRARGRLVALLRKSPDIVKPRCSHFGRCGGCQWQHLSLETQRRLKTRLVRDYLRERAEVRRDVVRDVLGGGEAWAYRNTVRAVFAQRDGVAVVGYHTAGGERVLDIAECPVQHPANEAILRAARHAVRTLGLPVYDPATGQGLVRGVMGMVAFATGQALLTLSTAAPLAHPSDLVHALIDRAPGLIGILHTIQPRPSPELVGPRLRLLWGRDTVEEEVAGLRFRLRPTTALPANPRAMDVLIDVVRRAVAARPGQTVVDLAAATPVCVLALAPEADAAVGIAPTRRIMEDARDAARRNGVTNAVFYSGHPLAELERLVRRGTRPAAVLLTAEGPGLATDIVQAVAAAAPPRVVVVARSLAACAHDVGRWRAVGYQVEEVQPLDLLPQTSHVHLVSTLRPSPGRHPPAS
jgi:23S rRNA (uracil-5-)-methyltransferase RumA